MKKKNSSEKELPLQSEPVMATVISTNINSKILLQKQSYQICSKEPKASQNSRQTKTEKHPMGITTVKNLMQEKYTPIFFEQGQSIFAWEA